MEVDAVVGRFDEALQMARGTFKAGIAVIFSIGNIKYVTDTNFTNRPQMLFVYRTIHNPSFTGHNTNIALQQAQPPIPPPLPIHTPTLNTNRHLHAAHRNKRRLSLVSQKSHSTSQHHITNLSRIATGRSLRVIAQRNDIQRYIVKVRYVQSCRPQILRGRTRDDAAETGPIGSDAVTACSDLAGAAGGGAGERMGKGDGVGEGGGGDGEGEEGEEGLGEHVGGWRDGLKI